MATQDIQFKEGEPEADRLKKLRALAEEMTRLGRTVSSQAGEISDLRRRVEELEAP
jgi:hypothetical protein